MTAMGHRMVTVSLLLLVMARSMSNQHSAVAFSEESLKDLSRLPHFQRHWLQRLDQQANTKRNTRLTTALPGSSTTTTTTTTTLIETTDESLEEVGERDERVTYSGPSVVSSSRHADGGADRSTLTLTISEAKERLKARKIKKSKIKTALMQQKEAEEDGHNYKKADAHLRDEKEEAVEVKKHIQRMANASCSTPALRLVYVRQQHEAPPNVRYLPACTWLHRCSDEIGCCTDDSKTCSASHIESVSLPFFVLTMTGMETKRTVTRLSFENHTSCECVGRNSDVMPRTEPYSVADKAGHHHRPSPLHDGANSSDEGKHHHEHNKKTKSVQLRRRPLGRVAMARSADAHLFLQQRDQEILAQQDEDFVSELAHAMVAQLSDAPLPAKNLDYSNVSQCRCPSGYTPVSSGKKKRTTCGMCQCYDEENRHHRHRHHSNHRGKWPSNHRPARHPLLRCGRLKRGLDTFSPRDRGCIIEKKCGTPECDYGRYMESAGRCPRRNELRPASTSVSG
ncbi:hypothetical protein GHT06_017572 [Daphnia sinensis]|uniref:Platelet-derived growth factor (PDGF) family profile domain-containing protein n=1 Tax=Daphnia sinensis TaxID=1820382 RepID=A0AAD5PTZ2_9CRUS|nr:hypothetical protein GHT06_017572 [Daphnia sinensis]